MYKQSKNKPVHSKLLLFISWSHAKKDVMKLVSYESFHSDFLQNLYLCSEPFSDLLDDDVSLHRNDELNWKVWFKKPKSSSSTETGKTFPEPINQITSALMRFYWRW